MPKMVSNIVDVYVYRRPSASVEFLVLRRGERCVLPGTWQAVHGHIEDGETTFETARRELSEETQLACTCWHQLESVNTFFVARTDEIHLCAGFAARVADDAEPTLNEEHDRFAWLPMDDALRRFHWEGQRRAVREIHDTILSGDSTADSLRL